MKAEIKKYFQFSRRERNGIFLLLFVLIGIIIVRVTFPTLFTLNNKEAQSVYQNHKDSVQNLKNKETVIPLKPFNPNTFSKDSLIKSGVPAKLAQQIINYKSKGGEFKIKQDFAKLYYLTDSSFKVFQPYLLLPSKLPKPQPISIEINSADSMQLLKVKGIGPFYAHKILKYKRETGGFFTLNQLEEAFYINANTLQEQQQRMAFIKKQLRVNPLKINKFNVNTATQKQLSHHAYITYRQSIKIVSLRKKKRIENWETLLAKKIFTEKEKNILIYYLKF